MEINAGLSLLDGKYEDGTFTEFRRFAFAGPTPQGCVATTGVPGSIDCQADLSGTSILQLPKAQWNIGATQTFYFGDDELRFHVDYSHVSSQVYFETAAHPAESDAAKASYAAVNAASILPSYGYANGRISYEFVDRGLELYLYARNLTNEKYLSGRYGELYNSLGFVQDFPGAPRMWGDQYRVRWRALKGVSASNSNIMQDPDRWLVIGPGLCNFKPAISTRLNDRKHACQNDPDQIGLPARTCFEVDAFGICPRGLFADPQGCSRLRDGKAAYDRPRQPGFARQQAEQVDQLLISLILREVVAADIGHGDGPGMRYRPIGCG